MTPAPDPNEVQFQARGAFRLWLQSVDLLESWNMTAELPPKTREFYRGLLLRHYLQICRKANRSKRSKLGGRP
jgi:hypothetical protein